MEPIRAKLKRCAAAMMFAVMMVAGIGVTILDAHALGADPHFDAPQHAACSPYDHNHSLCVFLTATHVLTTAPPTLLARTRVETTNRLYDAGAKILDGSTRVVRSRGPPHG